MFTDNRIKDSTHIGVVHDRVDVPLMSYIGATLQIDRYVYPALVSRFHDDPVALCKALMAYRKMLTADVAIIVQTFIDSRFVEAQAKSELLVDRLEEQTAHLGEQQDELDKSPQHWPPPPSRHMRPPQASVSWPARWPARQTPPMSWSTRPSAAQPKAASSSRGPPTAWRR